MTQNEIIRMAREARVFTGDPFGVTITPELERFAALVAAYEREACAKVCEERSHRSDDMGAICAAAIRARGSNGS